MCSAEFICGVSGRSDVSRPQKCMMRYLRTLTLSGFLFRDRPRTKGALPPGTPLAWAAGPLWFPHPAGCVSVADPHPDARTLSQEKEEKRKEWSGARGLQNRAMENRGFDPRTSRVHRSEERTRARYTEKDNDSQ